VQRVTIAGGVAKISKLAQGLTDLHSKRGEVDLLALAEHAKAAGGSADLHHRIVTANTAAQAFALATAAGISLGDRIARAAQETAAGVVAGCDIAIETAVFDRDRNLVGRASFKSNVRG
jgi:cobalt-precorrin-5B (C1)-methyltransferase